jgi:hypothetical protein
MSSLTPTLLQKEEIRSPSVALRCTAMVNYALRGQEAGFIAVLDLLSTRQIAE